jgi:hypothetical protein
MDLHARLDVNVLAGSYEDEPPAVGNDLGAHEIPNFLCLPDLGKPVLEDLVVVASLSGIWNEQVHLRDAADDEVEKSGEVQVDQLRRLRTDFLKSKVCLSIMLWKGQCPTGTVGLWHCLNSHTWYENAKLKQLGSGTV